MVDVPTASFEGVSKENVSALCDRSGLSYRGLVYNNKIIWLFLCYISIGWKIYDVIIRNNKITLDTVKSAKIVL